MHRERVIDLGPDALLLQMSPKFVSLRDPHGILIVDVEIARLRRWQCHAIQQTRRSKQLVIPGCIAPAAFSPLIKILALDIKHDGL